jgi:hypothetical protein
MDKMGVYDNKLCYVISALKKGIAAHRILKTEDPTVKTLYVGHTYQLF